jgi:cobalt-zinc-cadmium efflux system protein
MDSHDHSHDKRHHAGPAQEHGHDQGDDHDHHHHSGDDHHHAPATGKRLLLSLIFTLLFVVGEGIAGMLTNSLALLSDAGHNFADFLALGLTFYAVQMAKKPSDAKRSFGYHRVGILAALVNAVSLLVISFFIFVEAVHRFQNPELVQSNLMIGVALVAVLLNSVIGFSLKHGAEHDLNLKSAYVHMLGDAASAVGVVIAGIVIHFTQSTLADPIASLLIAFLILGSSWGILKEALQVLMEGVPAGMSITKIEEGVRQVPGVVDVHHFHVWSVSSGRHACSGHIIVAEQSLQSAQKIVTLVSEKLEHDFGIGHITIQMEVGNCVDGDEHCH